jgi:aldose 1-epimerase
MSGLLQLGSNSLELALAPPMGGAIANLLHTESGRKPLLRSSGLVPSQILETACFPLVPYCNRIRGGRFRFRGREVRIAPNMPGDPSPLHGQGWLAAWEVERATADEAELVFRHAGGEWPWTYEARQVFRVRDRRLDVMITCRNEDAEPMPCGLGQHPYFPCGPHTRLDTEVATVWTIDRDVLPIEEVPAAARYDLRDRLVCGQDLDHGFGGWGGRFRLTDPDRGFATELSSPDARFFQLYSPPAGGLIAAEPVSHANAALNEPEEAWPRLGLRVLAPGETMSLQMRIEVTPD